MNKLQIFLYKLKTLYYRILIFIATNHLFKIIIYFCYINFLYSIYHTIEPNTITSTFIADNDANLTNINRYAKLISIYFQQDDTKQYYGSINKENDEFLTSSFYLKYIINPEYIVEFLKTLNWSEIYKYDNETVILEYITEKYIAYFFIKEKSYYNDLITPLYIEDIKKEATTHLFNIFKDSKSVSIRTSTLINEKTIKHFLDDIDWDYYSKTADCSSRNFGYLSQLYSKYVTQNVSINYRALINYPIIQIYNFLLQNEKINVEFYTFKHLYYIHEEILIYAKKLTKFFSRNWQEVLEDNPLALVPINGAIEEHIISPQVLKAINEEYSEALKKALPTFCKIVFKSNYIIIFVSFIPIIKISW
jgi:hypothetical protein